MSEYEPDDSRTVTNSQNPAPGEPPRTGPREGEAHARAGQQAEQGANQPGEGADKSRALEGDSPNHPDRFGGTAQQDEQATQSDRWEDKADDSVPDGK